MVKLYNSNVFEFENAMPVYLIMVFSASSPIKALYEEKEMDLSSSYSPLARCRIEFDFILDEVRYL